MTCLRCRTRLGLPVAPVERDPHAVWVGLSPQQRELFRTIALHVDTVLVDFNSRTLSALRNRGLLGFRAHRRGRSLFRVRLTPFGRTVAERGSLVREFVPPVPERLCPRCHRPRRWIDLTDCPCCYTEGCTHCLTTHGHRCSLDRSATDEQIQLGMVGHVEDDGRAYLLCPCCGWWVSFGEPACEMCRAPLRLAHEGSLLRAVLDRPWVVVSPPYDEPADPSVPRDAAPGGEWGRAFRGEPPLDD